jgi:hypothetical protein
LIPGKIRVEDMGQIVCGNTATQVTYGNKDIWTEILTRD